MTCLEKDLQRKQQEYEARLHSVDDSHRHAMTELRKLLTNQQRMGAKYAHLSSKVCKKYKYVYKIKISQAGIDRI